MNISIDVVRATEPVGVRVAKGRLNVDLADGRTICVPLGWYPRLAHGTPAEWKNFHLNYAGIHWPDLNEDIAVEASLPHEDPARTPGRSGDGSNCVRKASKSRFLNCRYHPKRLARSIRR